MQCLYFSENIKRALDSVTFVLIICTGEKIKRFEKSIFQVWSIQQIYKSEHRIECVKGAHCECYFKHSDK